jgi:F-type H+-transporting ATPase subunit b
MLIACAPLCVAAAALASDPPAGGHAPEQAQAPAAHGADATHGEGEHPKASIFAGGIGNAIITLIIFGTVVAVLGSKAWPAVARALEERERAIRDSLEAARREREQAEQLLKQYEQQLHKARDEATAIVEEGRRDAEVVRRRIQEEARREAEEMTARARREIQLATDAAVKELYDRTAELATQVAAGIIRKVLSAEDHRALVDESLERMKADAAKLN